jgi:Flp pilus assembly protein TadD
MRRALILATLALAGCASVPTVKANDNAAILVQARELRQQDRASQAAAVVQRALLTTNPNDLALQGELARDLVFADPARALDIIEQAFDAAAPDAKLLMVGGVANDLLGRHAEAQQLYADALKIAPNDPAILANVEASRRMVADARTPKIVPPVAAKLAPVPVIVTAPTVAPITFAQRWSP